MGKSLVSCFLTHSVDFGSCNADFIAERVTDTLITPLRVSNDNPERKLSQETTTALRTCTNLTATK